MRQTSYTGNFDAICAAIMSTGFSCIYSSMTFTPVFAVVIVICCFMIGVNV